MVEKSEFRRYLVNIDSISTHQLFTDCLVIGAGIAGLRAAIEATEHCNVIIVCKDTVRDSNTAKAQGGVATVLSKADTFESHIADTLKTGCGICDEAIVDLVVRQGPSLIEQLLQWDTEFDLVDGHIATTLEGGHSYPRVAHAHGDETGRIILEALIKKVRQSSNIRIMENFFAIDLLTNEENKCIGMVGHDNHRGPQIIWAANTILASGGAGRLYRETTPVPYCRTWSLCSSTRPRSTLPVPRVL
jgi:L-aspartate oxidase